MLAVACGLAVANLYYPQPLLATIARSFRTGSGTVGLVVTSLPLQRLGDRTFRTRGSSRGAVRDICGATC
jgi:hypothetical protein